MEEQTQAEAGNGGNAEQESTFGGITSTLTKGLFGSDSPAEENGSVKEAASVQHSGAGEEGSRMSRNTPHQEGEPREEESSKRFSIIPLDSARRTLGLKEEEHVQIEEADMVREPSEVGGVELIEWIPTLPQLFLYMAITQLFVTFFWFIAYLTEDFGISHNASNQGWFQITSWVVLLLMTLVFLIYMWFVKHNLPRTVLASVFAIIAFMSFFQAPLTISDSARAYSATWAFFRCIFIAIIGILYTVAYREEIVPPRENLPPKARNFVVRHHLDTVPV